MSLLASWPSVVDDSGLKTDGTIFNKALTDAIKASVEDNVHSTTNPGLKTKQIIDEVVAARGSLADLNTRLSVLLNNDGTPKTIAGLTTTTQYQRQIGNVNLIANGDFRRWAGGNALAPDYWVLSGLGGTVARVGTGESDTTQLGAGQYSVKLTGTGATVTLTESVISSMSELGRLKGRKVSVVALGKATGANQLSIVVDDGIATTRGGQGGNGTYHTGSGNVEVLYVTHTINNSATKLNVFVENAQSGSVYAGGIFMVFADDAPLDWPPLTGWTVPLGLFATSVPGGRYYTNYGAVNSTTIETEVYGPVRYTPTMLDSNGRYIRAYITGTFAANGNTKTLKAYLGTSNVTLFSVTTSGGSWMVDLRIIRTGAATQIVRAYPWIGASVLAPVTASFTENLANELAQKITAISTANGDFAVDYLNWDLV